MKPTQDDAELAAFVELICSEGCSSYLEIGSKAGHSMEAVASALLPGSKIVSVDLPKKHGDLARLLLMEARNRLSKQYEVRHIYGDSTDIATITAAKAHAPFDLVFIDACHKASFVWADWNNYGPMARIVAFHDIADTAMGVAEVWNELKQKYAHMEIKLDARRNRNGIGVLWR